MGAALPSRSACAESSSGPAVEVPKDGITYDAESVRARPIREGAEYDGIRVKMDAHIGSARLRLQIDVGFGDAATPAPVREEFPPLLDDFPAPVIETYRPETVVAEKLHGMVYLGLANSRMKDYYDVWHLSQHREFRGPLLAGTIRSTFERRRTLLPEEVPVALTGAFAEAPGKERQWRAFAERSWLVAADLSLQSVAQVLRTFLAPPLRSLSKQGSEEAVFSKRWPPGGPWTDSFLGAGEETEA